MQIICSLRSVIFVQNQNIANTRYTCDYHYCLLTCILIPLLSKLIICLHFSPMFFNPSYFLFINFNTPFFHICMLYSQLSFHGLFFPLYCSLPSSLHHSHFGFFLANLQSHILLLQYELPPTSPASHLDCCSFNFLLLILPSPLVKLTEWSELPHSILSFSSYHVHISAYLLYQHQIYRAIKFHYISISCHPSIYCYTQNTFYIPTTSSRRRSLSLIFHSNFYLEFQNLSLSSPSTLGP